jgi:hypothetical protein
MLALQVHGVGDRLPMNRGFGRGGLWESDFCRRPLDVGETAQSGSRPTFHSVHIHPSHRTIPLQDLHIVDAQRVLGLRMAVPLSLPQGRFDLGF